MKRLSKSFLRNGALALVIVIVLVAFVVPIEHQIKGPGRFIASAEWTLEQIEQDKLQTNLIFQGMQKNDQISLFHFNRPDFIKLSLMHDAIIGNKINSGDVVAKLVSSEDGIRLSSLQGEMNEAQASLAAINTGAKEAYKKEGQEALQYAKSQLAAYEPILKRQKILFEKKLVSEQELEESSAQHDLLKINVSLQEARLQAALTGEKKEQIAVIESKVRASGEQFKIFSKKMEAQIIKTPISGIIVQPDRSAGELVHICSLDTVVIQMPIKASELRYIKTGMTIIAFLPGSKREGIEAEIKHIDHNATQVNMQPMYLATAIAVNENNEIFSGMTGYMKINVGTVSVWTLLKRAWANFHFNA